jgi:hypothetical protein
MNIKTLFVTLISLITSALGFSEDKPNILWIVGENLKLDLGCYGAKNVKTPNLDKLAAEGERYTKGFFDIPSLCSQVGVRFLWVCIKPRQILIICVPIEKMITVCRRGFAPLHTG